MRYIKWRSSSFLFRERWFRGENRWTNGCLHSQQEALSDAASAPHLFLVGCQAAPLLSHSTPLTGKCDRVTEVLRLQEPSWKVTVSEAPFLSHVWHTSGLCAHASASEVHRDKSHAKLDVQTQILIGHGGCAFAKRFIKRCCLHLTHDSSLTRQMPPLSIRLLASLQWRGSVFARSSVSKKNLGWEDVKVCKVWRSRLIQSQSMSSFKTLKNINIQASDCSVLTPEMREMISMHSVLLINAALIGQEIKLA